MSQSITITTTTTTISATSDTGGPTDNKSPDLQLDPPLTLHQSSLTRDALADIEESYLTSDSSVVPVSLPPVDGGRQAWAYVICATILETLVWGLPLSYGVFLEYYETVFPKATSVLQQVGVISTGIMYLFNPPLALYLAKHPHHRPRSMWLGIVLVTAGLIGAAFASQAWILILCQGVLYAIGGICLYCPVTAYMFEWWQRRRGLASGILFSGTGLGGLVVPFIAKALLSTYGQKTTCLAFAVSYAVLLSCAVPFIRPRLPLPKKETRDGLHVMRRLRQRNRREADTLPSPDNSRGNAKWDCLRRRAFWLLFSGVLLQGLGGFVPGTYLPSFASAIHLGSPVGTLSIALMNLARIPGQILVGHLSDKVSIRKLIAVMAIASSVSVYAIWGSVAATNGQGESEPRGSGTAGLLVFSILFGAFAGSYTALFPRFISIVAEDNPDLPQILYAFFSFARGVGNIASGPISTALLRMSSSLSGNAKAAYGVEGYGALIIFTGAALLASGVSAGYKGLKRD